MAFLLISWKVDALILLATISFLLYLYLTRRYDHWKKKGVPFLKPVPFFGNFLNVCLLRTSVGEILKNVYNSTEEPCTGFFVFDEPCLLIRDPRLAAEILVKNFNSFCDRNTEPNHKDDPIAAKMIFTLKNPTWKAVRSKMTPFFSSGNLKQHAFSIMNDLGKELKNYVGKVCLTKDSVEPKDLAAKYTTDLIANAAFGIGANCIQSEDANFRSVSKKMIEFSFSRSIQILIYFFVPKLVSPLKIKFFDPSSVLYFKKAIWHVIEEREKSKEKRSDLIDIFLRARRDTQTTVKFEDDIITGQSALIFLAGYEPMSAAISYSLYHLSLNQDIQDRLRTENDLILTKYNGELTYDGLKEMVYLEMVVMEILRMYPMLSYIQRQCVKDYEISESGITIEKGTSVYFSLFGIQRDSKYYSDPDKFNPERFAKENRKNIVPYTYVPFGIGPHNCIGERFGLLGAKVGLAHIISDYKVVPTENTPKQLKFEPLGFILAPNCNLALRFQNL